MDISLALGGGGSRGYSHIGVIRRLEQEGFRIRAAAGTSAGGIVAAAYATGISVDDLESIFAGLDQSKLFARATNEGPAILGLSGAMKELETILGERTFADLRIPCAVVAVDINTGTEVVLKDGCVVDAVMATIAVPGVFPPKKMGDLLLVDGAVLNPVPVVVARMLAPRLPVAAVALNSEERAGERINASALGSLPLAARVPGPLMERLTKTRVAQAFQIFLKSVDVGSQKLAELRLEVDKPDVIIRPKVGGIGLLDHVDVHKVVKIGERSVDQILPELHRMKAWPFKVQKLFFPGRVANDARRP